MIVRVKHDRRHRGVPKPHGVVLRNIGKGSGKGPLTFPVDPKDIRVLKHGNCNLDSPESYEFPIADGERAFEAIRNVRGWAHLLSVHNHEYKLVSGEDGQRGAVYRASMKEPYYPRDYGYERVSRLEIFELERDPGRQRVGILLEKGTEEEGLLFNQSWVFEVRSGVVAFTKEMAGSGSSLLEDCINILLLPFAIPLTPCLLSRYLSTRTVSARQREYLPLYSYLSGYSPEGEI